MKERNIGREGLLDIGSDGLNQTSLAVEGFELDLNQKLDWI